MYKAQAIDRLGLCNFSTRWCASMVEADEKIHKLMPKNENRYTIKFTFKDSNGEHSI